VVTASPPETSIPLPNDVCTAVALQLTSSLCLSSLLSLSNASLPQIQCQALCSVCLSAALTVATTACDVQLTVQTTISFECEKNCTVIVETPSPTETGGNNNNGTAVPQPTGEAAGCVMSRYLAFADAHPECAQAVLSVNGFDTFCANCLQPLLAFDSAGCSAFAAAQNKTSGTCAGTNPLPTTSLFQSDCAKSMLQDFAQANVGCAGSIFAALLSGFSTDSIGILCNACGPALAAVPPSDCTEWAFATSQLNATCSEGIPTLPPNATVGGNSSIPPDFFTLSNLFTLTPCSRLIYTAFSLAHGGCGAELQTWNPTTISPADCHAACALCEAPLQDIASGTCSAFDGARNSFVELCHHNCTLVVV